MQVGNVIKSYDFNGVDSCYMIGKIVSISEMDRTVRCEFMARVFDDEEVKKKNPDFFVAPLNGEMFNDKPEFPRLVVIA
jgi:hypothetical protein